MGKVARRQNDPKAKISLPRCCERHHAGENPFRAALDAEFTDTAWTGLRARHWLNELARGPQPFFLHVSFWKPHSPYEVAAPYDAMYDGVEIPIPDTVSRDAIATLPPSLQQLALRNGNGGPKLDPERTEWAYRSYYGTITHVDHEIGLLLDALEGILRGREYDRCLLVPITAISCTSTESPERIASSSRRCGCHSW